jgi:hypothetical protein
MECVKACPRNNIRLSLRKFGHDLLHTKKTGIIISIAASSLLGVSLFQTLAMMGSWESVLSLTAAFLGVYDFAPVFTVLFIVLAFLLPLGALAFFSLISGLASGQKFREVFASFGLLLIPQGIAIHLAHNLNHLLTEGTSIFSVIQFSVSPGSVNWAAPILQAGQVFWLQAVVILLGFFLSIYLGIRISKSKFGSLRPFIPVFILLLLVNLVSLYITGLPMSPRHIH